VFLLLGPTGTGKTKTVEALAEILHGSKKSVLRVDCGEFQMEHEVAKLIGAPPGYLGHRETQPMLTQQKLNAVTSEKCGLSLVLFDEIEKAAPSMTRLLLGVLDKGVLRLGDNSSVSFDKSLVFLTSNLGAREMIREINPDFGFQSAAYRARTW
jgi:ATP-dependent Clp protease ATP-binding subunit ClpA